jgi:hypothetical protein
MTNTEAQILKKMMRKFIEIPDANSVAAQKLIAAMGILMRDGIVARPAKI